MKKRFAVFIALCLILHASSCFGMIGLTTVTGSFEKLAKQIAAYNKPAIEIRLTDREKRYWGGYEYGRVWAKDKTIVIGFAGRDKNFVPIAMITADPKLNFANGLRVGMDMNALKKALKLSNREFKEQMEWYNQREIIDDDGLGGGFHYEILCDGGKAVQIYAQFGGGPAPKRINDFVYKMMRQLKFPKPDWQPLPQDAS